MIFIMFYTHFRYFFMVFDDFELIPAFLHGFHGFSSRFSKISIKMYRTIHAGHPLTEELLIPYLFLEWIPGKLGVMLSLIVWTKRVGHLLAV